jgi:raffinose/stachyose/melibiose transport system permease protein
LWFPLIISPSAKTATVTLGVQQFLGQFVSDWNAVLSSLTLAMVPILILYIIFSRQMIRSITAGAIK